MPYLIKTNPFDANEGEAVTLEEPPYYGGGDIVANEEAFIWSSETQGGRGLAWRGEVEEAARSASGEMTMRVRLLAQARTGALGIAELQPLRNIAGEDGLAGVARKAYRQSHNKVAALSDSEAAALRDRFPPA